MTQTEKLQLLKALVGESDTEEVLLAYLNIAGRKIINRAHPYDTDVTEVPTRYDFLQCEIAAYLLNKRGAEGQIQHIENGIHRNYGAADIPDGMMAEIVPFCKVVR